MTPCYLKESIRIWRHCQRARSDLNDCFLNWNANQLCHGRLNVHAFCLASMESVKGPCASHKMGKRSRHAPPGLFCADPNVPMN
jgi:hypothetical protein